MKICKSQIKCITYITAEDAGKMLDLLKDSDSPGEDMPEGLFIWKEAGKWISMDNLDGYAWVEEFAKEHDAVHWLLGW